MNEDILRFIKFVLVAIFRTLLDIVIWRVLVWLLPETSSIIKLTQKYLKLNRFAVAQAVSFVVSLVVSYVLNAWLVFEQSSTSRTYEVFRFGVISIIAFIASTWAMNILTSNNWILKQVKKIPILENHWPLTAKILTVGITTIINYYGYFSFVFV